MLSIVRSTSGIKLLRVPCRPEGSAEQTAGRPTTPELPNGNPLCTPRRLAAKPPSVEGAAHTGPPTPMQPPTATRRNDTSPGGRSAGQFTYNPAPTQLEWAATPPSKRQENSCHPGLKQQDSTRP